MLNKIIGIISWLPDNIEARVKRTMRFTRLLKQLGETMPGIDILVIAQNWKQFEPQTTKNNLIVVKYDKPLGIIQARQVLRDEFLKRDYDYIIMLDDDAILEERVPGGIQRYLQLMDEHPQGFAFMWAKEPLQKYSPYVSAQLNFCAVSRYIYEQQPIPMVDVDLSQGFEDRVFSSLLHYKYAEYEFIPPVGVGFCHFKNPNIDKLGGEVPSTWSRRIPHDWKKMRARTEAIEEYIVEHKELPDLNTF